MIRRLGTGGVWTSEEEYWELQWCDIVPGLDCPPEESAPPPGWPGPPQEGTTTVFDPTQPTIPSPGSPPEVQPTPTAPGTTSPGGTMPSLYEQPPLPPGDYPAPPATAYASMAGGTMPPLTMLLIGAGLLGTAFYFTQRRE